MKKFILCSFVWLAACASNPNKAQNLTTTIEKAQPLSAGEEIGIKKNELIIQRKELVAEELRRLQFDVHGLEDHTYGGDRYFGNPGAWGMLNDCRLELASVANGGTGKMSYIEPLEYVVPEEDFSQIGFDEKGQLISLTEEYLKDRITRYQHYKQVLEERNRKLTDEYQMCRLDLQAQKLRQKPQTPNQVANQN